MPAPNTDLSNMSLATESTEATSSPIASSDSSSPLSSAPNSPIWPEVLKMCEERDCPVRNPHYQGRYLYGNKPPYSDDTIFGSSNPPAFVWESYAKIQRGGGDTEDDWILLSFIRYHVMEEGTSFQPA